jgi:hypothetical protein
MNKPNTSPCPLLVAGEGNQILKPFGEYSQFHLVPLSLDNCGV